ncbi:MAG: rRNA pseudouridine synthase [Desulfobacterales bacterium]|uniref:Pseudouridine synthase n=1 Tax=Candidatus Desulfaltia bathyphila TaxID=2841697 RepID=A0A8J6N3K1_9BACT|nr:rRNA pseudouridine synthase [Candidatus Desulfaltia bathyphila]MBL7208353.1 rRNA pseudouridine synthase [Desulfobacterales bacterium]
MELMRLQKFLSMAGVCSRRHGEKHITNGDVKVNGNVVTQLGTKIDPKKDRVEVKGRYIEFKQDLVYIALNKPRGYVTSCKQPGDKIVLDLLDISMRVYPIGRLDKDSTGLLLLTNDGGLHHRLSHPSFDHEKEYEVTVANPMTDRALMKIEQGMPIMGTKTRPAETKRISPKRFRIVLKEGKNRQIRRMVEKTGNRVTRLNRIRVANIRLGKLARGTWRHLTEKEKVTLLAQQVKPL